MTKNTDTPAVPVGLALVCPYCSGTLYVSTRSEGGSAWSSYEVPDLIECNGDIACNAEWNPNGEVASLPNFMLYPDTYSLTNKD